MTDWLRRAAGGLPMVMGLLACAGHQTTSAPSPSVAAAPTASGVPSTTPSSTASGASANNRIDLLLGGERVFVGNVSVEVDPTLGRGEVALELGQIPAEGLGELSRRKVVKPRGERFAVDVERIYPRTEPLSAALRKCTFVIDCDTPEVGALHEKLKARFGASPGVGDLESFVDTAIPRKNLLRGFDIASVVARRGEGDCSEHAVLLAALARASGRSARVVSGLVLVSPKAATGSTHVGGSVREGSGTKPIPQAFGHMWVELHEAGRYRVADAALRPGGPGPDLSVTYLPFALLSDESPAYAGSWMRQFTVAHVKRVWVAPPDT